MLGSEKLTIVVGGEIVTLRPSLRVALSLHRAYGGFDKLAKLIAEQSLSTMCDVIEDHHPVPYLEHKVLASLDELTEPLLRYVFMCAGHDPDEPEPVQPIAAADRVPFDTYFERLFGIGTGWLGWTPEQTWGASPAEIVAAHRGRLDMLRIIFGSPDKGKDKGRAINDPGLGLGQKFRLAFAGRGTKVVHRGSTDA